MNWYNTWKKPVCYLLSTFVFDAKFASNSCRFLLKSKIAHTREEVEAVMGWQISILDGATNKLCSRFYINIKLLQLTDRGATESRRK